MAEGENNNNNRILVSLYSIRENKTVKILGNPPSANSLSAYSRYAQICNCIVTMGTTFSGLKYQSMVSMVKETTFILTSYLCDVLVYGIFLSFQPWEVSPNTCTSSSVVYLCTYDA